MARYIVDFPIVGTPEQMYNAVYQYLSSEGYKDDQVKGENVLKCGDGWVAAPTCFKFSFYGNVMRMETWMLYAILPGVFAGEIGVTGFVGCAVKGPWKKRIAHIEQMFAVANPCLSAGMAAIPAYTQQAAAAVNNTWAQATATAQQAARQAQGGRFCCNCGAPMDADAAFCTNCGTRV